MPMHGVVRSHLYTRLSRSLRLPSVAGTGLPERMRSTAFAFLGLTAAVGLALVAIFAQLSFPVLAPAPAPSGPQASAVSDAVSLEAGPGRPMPAAARNGGAERPAAIAEDGPVDGVGGGGQTGAVDAPAPAPVPSSEPGTGTPSGEPAPAPAPQASPKPPSEQPAPSTSQPDATAKPSKPEPTPARPAAPEPEPAPAPGNSQSSAAAEHASDRGVEASSKSSTAAVAPEAAVEDSPGNGNGKALGHSK